MKSILELNMVGTIPQRIDQLEKLPYDRMSYVEIEEVQTEIRSLQASLYEAVFKKELVVPELEDGVDVCDAIEHGLKYEHDIHKRVELAKEIMVRYGGIDGSHHKAWCLDQMFRALTGPQYHEAVAVACDGEDGPNTYEWDEGCPP